MNQSERSSGPLSLLSYFLLFTSVGTLLCCALPSLLLVLAGLVASVASTLSIFPVAGDPVAPQTSKPFLFPGR